MGNCFSNKSDLKPDLQNYQQNNLHNFYNNNPEAARKQIGPNFTDWQHYVDNNQVIREFLTIKHNEIIGKPLDTVNSLMIENGYSYSIYDFKPDSLRVIVGEHNTIPKHIFLGVMNNIVYNAYPDS